MAEFSRDLVQGTLNPDQIDNDELQALILNAWAVRMLGSRTKSEVGDTRLFWGVWKNLLPLERRGTEKDGEMVARIMTAENLIIGMNTAYDDQNYLITLRNAAKTAGIEIESRGLATRNQMRNGGEKILMVVRRKLARVSA